MPILTKKLRSGHWPKDFSIDFSLESSGTSDTHRQTRSTIKSQKNPSKNKEPTHIRRSRRLEDRSTTKEKARRERSKPRRKRSRHQETSLDSEYEEGSDDAFKELNSPYKRPKPTPFTQIITHFKYHKRTKLPRNIKQNEGLQAFMDRFKSEISHIKGVPPVLRIPVFMHGHSHPELAKKLNDKIPKTVDKMFEMARAFIRGEMVGGLAEMVHPSQGGKGYKKQIEEAMASRKLAHLVKDIRRNNQRNRNQGRNGVKVINLIRVEGSRKRPFEEGRSSMMDDLTFPAIPQKVSQKSYMNTASETLMSASGRNSEEEVFTISQECPDQYVMMGATLTTNCKQLMANVVRENIEIFTWTGSERTAVPRFVMEHKLKIYPLAESVVHKRRPVAPEGRLALKEKVFHWLGEGLSRKVLHPEWITNAIPIKLTNGTWKVQMDYSGLNKACAKDMYPLLEEGEELASLLGYPYKCFLQLPKEYNQIRMAEEEEEKAGFHTEEGVYCFTHMPKELKNSATTLQRMMEKVLTDQRGWNVEIYLEVIVIKSKSELDLVL
ncbi:hypothetical protein Tco_1390611, partial [Tanacetum coccineum]